MLFSCAMFRRLLAPYYDGELSVEEQIRVETHLEICHRCAEEVATWQRIGEVMRRDAPAVENLPVGLQAEIMGQLDVERRTSLTATLGRMFEDMHLVWAALAATSATLLCAAVATSVLSLAMARNADSLAGLVAVLASPGSNVNPVSLDTRMSIPRVTEGSTGPFVATSGIEHDDLVFALAAVVTQEGRVRNPEVLLARGGDRELVLGLMSAVTNAQFEPASYEGVPVAVNLVWLLAHTTVRAKLLS